MRNDVQPFAGRMLLGVCLVGMTAGCQWVSRGELTAAEGRLRVLGEQNQVQLSELAAMRAHTRQLEDRVIELERERRGDPAGELVRRPAEPRAQRE